MNKNVIIGIVIAVVILIIAGAVGFNLLNKNNNETQEFNGNRTSSSNKKQEILNNENASSEAISNEDNKSKTGNKTLVVYYSASGTTEKAAKLIANTMNADIFEIEPVNKYSDSDLNWTNNNSRVSQEHNDESKRNVPLKNTKVDNWEDYDTVLIGYPIWWGIAAWPVDNFVKANDFSRKTVIPFCTAYSSGIGQSGTLLEKMAGTGNWEKGQRFQSSFSEKEVINWANSIK